MPSFAAHLGITIATFAANAYFKTTGHIKYGTNLLALASTLLILVRNNCLVPYMFLPSIFMSKLPDHVSYTNGARSQIQKNHPETCSFIKLTTKDGVELDGMILRHGDHNHLSYADSKWLIWFNPNGASYEEMLDFLGKYCRQVGVSLLAFNYRGVGKSSGNPTTAEDLVTDGEAAIAYLINQGVQTKDILLHGHSMGGAVAAKIRGKFPDGPIINDRSFRSLNHVVLSLTASEPGLGALAGGLVGAILGGVVAGTYACSYPVALYSSVLGAIASGFVGSKWAHIHGPVIKLALSAMQWDLDIEQDWKNITGHKIVIYHALDGLIHHERASLFSAIDLLTDEEKQKTKFLRLEYQHSERSKVIESKNQVYHVYSLDTFRNDWDLIVKEARAGLGIS